MDAPIKLIAYMSYSTVTNALVVTGSRNCSGFWTAVGIVDIRVGPPGPLTGAAAPAAATTEWSRAVGNILPVVVIGTAARSASVIQTNDTTYQINTWDLAVPGAAESAIWFGLFQIAV